MRGSGSGAGFHPAFFFLPTPFSVAWASRPCTPLLPLFFFLQILLGVERKEENQEHTGGTYMPPKKEEDATDSAGLTPNIPIS